MEENQPISTPVSVLPRWGALFVLYFSDFQAVLERAERVVAAGGMVLLVDNTPEPQDLRSLPQGFFDYLHNKNEGGIAGALNRGAEWGERKGLEWLLTMDQDSSVELEWLEPLLKATAHVDQRCALLTPFHNTKTHPLPLIHNGEKEKIVPIRDAMSSGNLIRLSAWRAVGGFDERLFIDQVDHDFSLRLLDSKWWIGLLPSAVMQHPLGNVTFHKLPWRKRQPVSNHSPLRRYTITRNRLFVVCRHALRHPRFALRELLHLWNETLCLLLFEKERKLKLQMVFYGVRDFLLRRWGAPPKSVVEKAMPSKN